LKGAGIGAGIGAVAGPAISAMAGGNPAVGKLVQAATGAALGAPAGALIGAINKDEKRKKAKLAKAKKDKEDKKDKKTKEEFELEQAFEDIMGQFSDHVCEECGKQKLTAKEIDELANLEEGKRHGNSKIYDKCWSGCHRVAGKKRGEPGSCKCDEGDDDTMDVKINSKGQMMKADEPDAEEQKTPLGEFILSYYDRETGEFPKGETAVLTMVEKDYGEQFIEPAKAFIEQVQALYDDYQMRTQPQQMEVDTEFDRMKELAGLR